MKPLIAAALANVILLAVLFLGVSASIPALLLPAVCAWTPAAWWLGYAFARVNGRFQSPIAVPVQPAPARKRNVSPTEFN